MLYHSPELIGVDLERYTNARVQKFWSRGYNILHCEGGFGIRGARASVEIRGMLVES